MIEENFRKDITAITEKYGFPGTIVGIQRIGGGHINDTFKVDIASSAGAKNSYVYQRVNDFVFTRPELIMENIRKVSDYIISKFGVDSPEEKMVLAFEKNLNGDNFTNHNGFWRVSKYVDSATYDAITDGKVLYNTGYAFGRFQDILSGMDAGSLVETIPDFHNTKKRVENFLAGVQRNTAGRVSECEKEIAFLEKYQKNFTRLVELHECGILPFRVTHNDTKYNNILIDRESGKPVCVVDLDTVMPGLCAYDFGDAIRGAANNAAEDEIDLSKVGLNVEYYEQLTKGFVTAAKPFLTTSEKDSLALGAMTMTYEVATRFLLDYFDGDVYFKTTHPTHNLERARCQIRLCEDMIANYDKMCGIVDKYYN